MVMGIPMKYIWIVVSYLVGSIPFGFIAGKLKGLDVREHGSGNVGGTNVGRILGLPYGILVTILDVSKIFFLSYFFGSTLYGIVGFFGYVFSIYLKFQGGKGMSSIAGIAIYHAMSTGRVEYFLIPLISMLPAVFLTKQMSLGSITATLIFTSLFVVNNSPFFPHMLLVAAVLLWAHRSNIHRLRTGEELKIERVEE